MKSKPRFWAVLAVMLAPTSAFAYLDPGTGSMLLQVILGGVAAATVALKLYWQRIKQALGLAKPMDTPDETDPVKPSE